MWLQRHELVLRVGMQATVQTVQCVHSDGARAGQRVAPAGRSWTLAVSGWSVVLGLRGPGPRPPNGQYWSGRLAGRTGRSGRFAADVLARPAGQDDQAVPFGLREVDVDPRGAQRRRKSPQLARQCPGTTRKATRDDGRTDLLQKLGGGGHRAELRV